MFTFDGYVGEKRNSPLSFLEKRKMISVSNPRARLACLFVTGSLLMIFLAKPARAQVYAGALGGISTLSGDTSAAVNSTSTNFSTYNPNNGLALNALVGKHLTDIFTVQGEYVWNRNSLDFTEATFDPGSPSAYEETRHSSQQSLFGSVLIYFRSRKSWIRPYLSVGTGWVHLSSTQASVTLAQNSPSLPPASFSANMIALRVPVGADVKIHNGWRIRYTFSETISRNPISHELSPPGLGRLKNFQNLFGIIYRF